MKYHRVRYVKIGELEKTLNEFSKDDYAIIKIEQYKGDWVVIGTKDNVPYTEYERVMKAVE